LDLADPSSPCNTSTSGPTAGTASRTIVQSRSRKSPSGVVRRSRSRSTPPRRRSTRAPTVCAWAPRNHHGARKAASVPRGLALGTSEVTPYYTRLVFSHLAAIRRASSVTVLLVQLCALIVWPALDPGDHAPMAPHVEAPGSNHCPPAHDEARCQICQASTVRVAATPIAPATFATVVEIHLTPTAPSTPVRRVIERHRRSRSPPLPLG
jgi:hypothetical protein